MKLLIFLLFPLLLNAQLIEKDKQLHALAGSVLTFPTYAMGRELKMTKFESFMFSVGVTSLIGIGKELIDKPTTGFDWKDAAFTTGGSLITATIIVILD